MQLSPKRAVDDAPAIPDRLYFKIGDVARICGVQTYVLRFWETQFPQLKPNKSGTGQRLYRRPDVELALRIKHLVHTEGYTIAGARQALDQGHRRGGPRPAAQIRTPQPATQQAAPKAPQSRLAFSTPDPARTREDAAAAIAHARAELREIAGLLASPQPQLPRRRARLTTMPSAAPTLFSL